MIIDRNYIIERVGRLTGERFEAETTAHEENLELYRRKQRFPRWLRRILFHPLNPAYAIWKTYRARREQGAGRDPFALAFAAYCYRNEGYRLDTADFAGPDDERLLVDYVDNRLRGALELPIVRASESKAGFAAFRAAIERTKQGWVLPLDGKKWLLPVSPEAYGAWIHYGLDLLPAGVRGYVAGKDFVDVGAFVGDSAIYMLGYAPRKIYGFEPSPVNYVSFIKTIQENGLDEVVPLRRGLSDAPSTAHIVEQRTGSHIATDPRQAAGAPTIEISTIDRECREMNVGVIKMDVEGFEYNAVKGALETIRRDRPVLLISAYHTGRDFFEILPMLRALGKDYHFRFLDLNPEIVSEKLLAAYPAELA